MFLFRKGTLQLMTKETENVYMLSHKIKRLSNIHISLYYYSFFLPFLPSPHELFSIVYVSLVSVPLVIIKTIEHDDEKTKIYFCICTDDFEKERNSNNFLVNNFVGEEKKMFAVIDHFDRFFFCIFLFVGILRMRIFRPLKDTDQLILLVRMNKDNTSINEVISFQFKSIKSKN